MVHSRSELYIIRLKMLLACFSVLGITVVSCSLYDNEVELTNSRPIVGVLAQELPPESPFSNKFKSFIPASYVKFLESGGARVVPIWINQTKSYYENILGCINGVLFPGGSSDFNARYGYAEAGSYIYNAAKIMNSKGDYFPLWGTCQGFELLAFLGANLSNPLTVCSLDKVNLNLNFLADFNSSKLFAPAPTNVIKILQNDPVTPNFHRFCLTPENLTLFMGDENWRIMSLNEDSKGLMFISTMESRIMPAYGVQFHPEKVMFEWSSSMNIAHSFSAIQAAQYFSNFFVNEARKNFHSFPSQSKEFQSLIYNYQPTYTGATKGEINEQLYLFM